MTHVAAVSFNSFIALKIYKQYYYISIKKNKLNIYVIVMQKNKVCVIHTVHVEF